MALRLPGVRNLRSRVGNCMNTFDYLHLAAQQIAREHGNKLLTFQDLLAVVERAASLEVAGPLHYCPRGPLPETPKP
jgi:hypothetical protein